jgi:hypothetical protein
MAKYKIAVGMITGDHKVHRGLLASLFDIINSGRTDYNFTPIFRNSIYVDKNRTFALMEFVSTTDCDYFLFLDADNGLSIEALDFFMEDFEDPEVNVVTGKYLYKGTAKAGLMVVGYRPNPIDQPWLHYSLPEGGFSKDLINVTQELGEAIVGCGCLMIRRKVIEELPYPWFETIWWESPLGGHMHIGEDLFFSTHLQKHGFDIHFDQRIKSPHYAGSECYPPEWNQINRREGRDNGGTGEPLVPQVISMEDFNKKGKED